MAFLARPAALALACAASTAISTGVGVKVCGRAIGARRVGGGAWPFIQLRTNADTALCHLSGGAQRLKQSTQSGRH